MKRHILFFQRFLLHPTRLGAFAPSSRTLARRMVRGLELTGSECVVEYGPGLGAITGEILAAKGPRARYLAIEKDPEFARILSGELPGERIVCGDARDVEAILARLGLGPVDTVLSGLPFSFFPVPVQREIVVATHRVLREGGTFLTFGYLHAWPLARARAFRRLLTEVFGGVEWYPVMKNLPPALVLACRKARVPAALPAGRPAVRRARMAAARA